MTRQHPDGRLGVFTCTRIPEDEYGALFKRAKGGKLAESILTFAEEPKKQALISPDASEK